MDPNNRRKGEKPHLTLASPFSQKRVPEDHTICSLQEAMRYIQGTSYNENSDYELFAKEINILFGIKDKRILEFCSGPGRLALKLGEYKPTFVLGIDASKEMIEHSQRINTLSEVMFERQDVLNPNGALRKDYDLVVSQNSMHHFNPEQLPSFFKAGINAINVGGYMYVADYRREEIEDAILIERLVRTNPHVKKDFENTLRASYTRREIEEVLNSLADKIEFEVFYPEREYRRLQRDSAFTQAVSNDPHPHHLDYGLSLRIKIRKIK